MSFEDELRRIRQGQDAVNTRLDYLERFLGAQGYQPPTYAKPITKAECERLGGKWDEDTGKCELTESVVAIELPKTKEACEKAGGTWDEKKNFCKLSKEAIESFRGILPSAQGVLPIAGVGIDPDEAKANALIKKIVGE